VINRPLGYPMWFIAGYPDIVNYFSLPGQDKEMEGLFGDIPTEEGLDENQTFKMSVLRKIVDLYKKSGNVLEVSNSK